MPLKEKNISEWSQSNISSPAWRLTDPGMPSADTSVGVHVNPHVFRSRYPGSDHVELSDNEIYGDCWLISTGNNGHLLSRVLFMEMVLFCVWGEAKRKCSPVIRRWGQNNGKQPLHLYAITILSASFFNSEWNASKHTCVLLLINQPGCQRSTNRPRKLSICVKVVAPGVLVLALQVNSC
jgi:hypothetical protein